MSQVDAALVMLGGAAACGYAVTWMLGTFGKDAVAGGQQVGVDGYHANRSPIRFSSGASTPGAPPDDRPPAR